MPESPSEGFPGTSYLSPGAPWDGGWDKFGELLAFRASLETQGVVPHLGQNQRFFHESGRRERSLDETTAKWILPTLRIFYFLLIFVICPVVPFFPIFPVMGHGARARARARPMGPAHGPGPARTP